MVGGTVVHDPEDPVSREVGFLPHNLVHQVHERLTTGPILHPARRLPSRYVQGQATNSVASTFRSMSLRATGSTLPSRNTLLRP